jgi:autotransporter adhesin
MLEIIGIYVFSASDLYFHMQFDLPAASHPILRKIDLILALSSMYFLEFSVYIGLRSMEEIMKKRTYLAIIASLSLMYGQAMVFAADNTTNNTTGSVGIVIEGDNNTVSSSNSITLGNYISSLGGANVAIGYNSKAGSQKKPKGPNEANGATAVGTGSQAVNYRATALGDYTVASGTDSLGLGTTAKATGDRSVAAGLSSQASGVNAIAIGDKAVSRSSDSVAIGENAKASNSQAIAIGSASFASGKDSLGLGTTAKATGNRAISAGRLSQASGLNAIAIGDKAKSTSNDTVAIGEKAIASGSQAIAIGSASSASGNYSVAIGLNAKAGADWSVALGNGSETSPAVSTRTMTVGEKTYETAGGFARGTVSIGNDNIKRTITNVAAGRVLNTSTDAVNGSQLYATNQSVDENAKNIAANAKNIAQGMNFAADTGSPYNAQLGDTISIKSAGKNLSTSMDKGTITVHMSDTPVFTTVTADTVAGNTIKAGNTVTISREGADFGGTKITHLKDGEISPTSTDAVNGSQLYGTEVRINQLGGRINKVGAGAAALAALHPLDFDPEDKWNFAAGYGNYRNANSTAVGAFYRPNDDTMFSVATNFGNGENMINAGVSFKFGRSGKSPVLMGSKQEIKELQEVVARQDDQLKKQDKEIRELKAMVRQLLAAQGNKTAD